MADTKRALSALQTLLADNATHDISAQDVRDFLLSTYGSLRSKSITSAETPYTATLDDNVIIADATIDTLTIQLPTGTAYNDQVITVVKSDATGDVVFINSDAESGDTFADGMTTKTLDYQFESITVIKIGTLWYCLNYKQVRKYFYNLDYTANIGKYRSKPIAGSGDMNITFAVPNDFLSFISLSLVAINTAATPGTVTFGVAAGNINITSQYSFNGQNYDLYTGIGTGTFIMPVANKIFKMPVDSAFASLTPGNFCGLNIAHNAIGGTVDYLGIELIYYAK